MPDITFVAGMLSSTTYDYHDGDFGVFRAFAHADAETGNSFDAENINYTWTLNGDAITAAMYSEEIINKGVYAPDGSIISVTAEADVYKPKIFGVFSPVLRTPPLRELMDGDIFTCTAQHKKGGNIITHNITISFVDELVLNWSDSLYDTQTRRGLPINGTDDTERFETSWRPVYWNRSGVVGEVCQYGRIIENLIDGIREKRGPAVYNGHPFNPGYPTVPPYPNRNVFAAATCDILTREVTDKGTGTGGIPQSFNRYAVPTSGSFPNMDFAPSSKTTGLDDVFLNANNLLLIGHVDRVSPITAEGMHYLQDYLAHFAEVYAAGESSPGGLSFNLTAKDIMDAINPAVPAVEVLYDDSLIYTENAYILPAEAGNLQYGAVLSKDTRSYMDGIGYIVDPADVTGNRLNYASSMVPTNYLNHLDDYDVTTPDANNLFIRLTYGTHRLRAEPIVTVSRPAGTLLYSDPESVNGTLIKAYHFEGIRDAISLMSRMKVQTAKGEVAQGCPFAKVTWNYRAITDHGQVESIHDHECTLSTLHNQTIDVVTTPDFISLTNDPIVNLNLDVVTDIEEFRTTRYTYTREEGESGAYLPCGECYANIAAAPACGDPFIMETIPIAFRRYLMTLNSGYYYETDALTPTDPYCDMDVPTSDGNFDIDPCPVPSFTQEETLEFLGSLYTDIEEQVYDSGFLDNVRFEINFFKESESRSDVIYTLDVLDDTQEAQWECDSDEYTIEHNDFTFTGEANRAALPRLGIGYTGKVIAGGRNTPLVNDKTTPIQAQETSSTIGLWNNLDDIIDLRYTMKKTYILKYPLVETTYTSGIIASHDLVNIPKSIALRPALGGNSLEYMPEQTTDAAALGFYFASHKVTEDDDIWYESPTMTGVELLINSWGDKWYGSGGAPRIADDLYARIALDAGVYTRWGRDFSVATSCELNFNHVTNGGRLFSMIYI